MSRIRKSRFGTFLEKLRYREGLTLREFCKRAECDPANISRIERGLIPPPQAHEILERYALALGLTEGSDDWHNFLDYASADHGIIPADIMEDATLVDLLPAFFRTMRGEKPTNKEMKRIAEKLKNI